MTKDEAVKCVESGIELATAYARKGYHIVGTGDMGIGNTTPSAAILAAATGMPSLVCTPVKIDKAVCLLPFPGR